MPTSAEKDDFSETILELAVLTKQTCIETVCMYCEDTSLEPEVAASLVNEVLKARIRSEAMDLNYLEKASKLPL